MNCTTAGSQQAINNEVPANIAEDVIAGLYALEGATGDPRGEIRRMIIRLRDMKEDWKECSQ